MKQREILFRGKRVDNEKWIKGDLIHRFNMTIIHRVDNGCGS